MHAFSEVSSVFSKQFSCVVILKVVEHWRVVNFLSASRLMTRDNNGKIAYWFYLFSNAVHDCTEINVGSSKHFLRWCDPRLKSTVSLELHVSTPTGQCLTQSTLPCWSLHTQKLRHQALVHHLAVVRIPWGWKVKLEFHLGTCPWQLSEERSALIQSWADFGWFNS